MAGIDWRHDTLDRIRVLIEETDAERVTQLVAASVANPL
jgi:hypothetical protein